MNYATKQPYPRTGTNGLVVSGPNSACYPQPVTGLDMTSVKNWLSNKNATVGLSNGVLLGGAVAVVVAYLMYTKSHHRGSFGRDFAFDF